MESIFESLENLNVSEACFEDIMSILEELLNEDLKSYIEKKYGREPKYLSKNIKGQKVFSKVSPSDKEKIKNKKDELLKKVNKVQDEIEKEESGKSWERFMKYNPNFSTGVNTTKSVKNVEGDRKTRGRTKKIIYNKQQVTGFVHGGAKGRDEVLHPVEGGNGSVFSKEYNDKYPKIVKQAGSPKPDRYAIEDSIKRHEKKNK